MAAASQRVANFLAGGVALGDRHCTVVRNIRLSVVSGEPLLNQEGPSWSLRDRSNAQAVASVGLDACRRTLQKALEIKTAETMAQIPKTNSKILTAHLYQYLSVTSSSQAADLWTILVAES